jgi:hypothetical protein
MPDTLTLIHALRAAAELALDAEPLGPLPVNPSMSVDPRQLLDVLDDVDLRLAAFLRARDADTPSRCLDCDMNPGLCDIHGATPVLTALELANYPIRVVVDQHGHYWRDYGDHWSMCPVSDENRATTPAYEFYPLDHIDVDRLREAARRSGMPRVVSVADIEDLAAEYNYMVERPEEPHDA